MKAEATVKFGVGSSSLTPDDEEALTKLAATATGLTGYIIEVTGYADSTGSPAMNTKLSEDREALITYLMHQGRIPVRHIVAPGAMDEYGPAASNETAAGRAENRRVEVKVLVNKGITGVRARASQFILHSRLSYADQQATAPTESSTSCKRRVLFEMVAFCRVLRKRRRPTIRCSFGSIIAKDLLAVSPNRTAAGCRPKESGSTAPDIPTLPLLPKYYAASSTRLRGPFEPKAAFWRRCC